MNAGTCLVCSVLCSIASNVTQQDGGIREELPELAVGDDQCAKCTETVKGLVAVLLRGLLVYWCLRGLGISTGHLLSLPDEVLEEVALVLGEQQGLRLLNDILDVSNEALAFGGQLLGR